MKLHLPFRNISITSIKILIFYYAFDPKWFFFCVHMTTHYINEREPMLCAHYSNSYYKNACFLRSNAYILKGIPTDKIYQARVGMRLGQLSHIICHRAQTWSKYHSLELPGFCPHPSYGF